MVSGNRLADPLGFVKSAFSTEILAFTQPCTQKYWELGCDCWDVIAVWLEVALHQRPPCQVVIVDLLCKGILWISFYEESRRDSGERKSF